jgi:hypothetical protein
MVSVSTFDEVIAHRDTGKPETGFRAALPTHQVGHDERFMETTVQGTFGVGRKATRTQQRRLHGTGMAPSGAAPVEVAFGQEVPVQRLEKMAGEVYKTRGEPQHNTAAQRSWMYTEDPGIKVKTGVLSTTGKEAMGVSLRLSSTGKQIAQARVSTTLTKGGGGVFMDD